MSCRGASKDGLKSTLTEGLIRVCVTKKKLLFIRFNENLDLENKKVWEEK